ncbi:MAG: acyltransferase [Verrucomicrobiaceae bacterium]|nr:acyltransferase [Verrucomicrobiaceae bacterium]
MIRSLQVFRAVAAMLVMVQHLNIVLLHYFGGTLPNEVLMPVGYAGVQFFFVLSGFILYHAHRSEKVDPTRLPRYLGKRAARILPLYWLVTLAVLPAWYLVPSSGEDYHRSLSALLSSLLLLPQPHDPHLTVGWTLIHEGAFYVFFSLFFLTRRFHLLALVWALAIGYHWMVPGGGWLTDFYLSPHNLLFLAGIAIAAHQERIQTHISGRWLFSLGIAGAVIGGIAASGGTGGNLATLAFGAAALLLVMAAAGGGIEPLFARRRFLVFLGTASYAIYLIHFPLMIALAKVLVKLEPQVAPSLPVVIVLLFGTALGAGILLHLGVEKPLLQASKRLLRSRRDDALPSPVAST